MSSDARLYPGRLEHGPEEKFGLFGLEEGISTVLSKDPIKTKTGGAEYKLLSANVNSTSSAPQLGLPN